MFIHVNNSYWVADIERKDPLYFTILSILLFSLSTPTPPASLGPHLIVEEVHSVIVEFQWQGLEEGDVVGHDLLVREVKLVDDDGVHVVVRQEVIWEEKRENLAILPVFIENK